MLAFQFPFRSVMILGLLLGLAASHLWQAAGAEPQPTRQAPSAVAQRQAGGGTRALRPTDAPVSPGSGALEAGGETSVHRQGTEEPNSEGDAKHEGHDASFKQLLVALIVLLIGAKMGGALFERFGQPAVLGEIMVGILLGNLGLLGVTGLEYLRTHEALIALSELGVVVLLFEVGLESNVGEMSRVGWSALIVATLGVVVPTALGMLVGRMFLPHGSWLEHLFIGATLCATSVGITARVLKDLGQLQRSESKIILGAAVIDDVMGLVVLAVVSGIIKAAAEGGQLSLWGIALIVIKAVVFLVGALAVGRVVSPRMFRLAGILNVQHMLLVTSGVFCLLLARLAAEIGLAPIVGAFAAGLILDPVHYQDLRDRGEHTIEELVHPISGLLVPVFFVMTGMNVDLRALGNGSVLGFAACLTLAAIVGKQVCGLGILERGLDRLAVGFGMIPRGEVGLIFANVGRSLVVPGADGTLERIISADTFSAVVVMVMVTTLITPPLLKWSMSRGVGRRAVEQAGA